MLSDYQNGYNDGVRGMKNRGLSKNYIAGYSEGLSVRWQENIIQLEQIHDYPLDKHQGIYSEEK